MTVTSDTAVAEALPADPFTALAVHYGMLLGVPDFQTMLANPRGKLRLHQAWQHGPGVVWGFDVTVPADSSELRVSAGLAVDGVGREVALAVEHCMDVAQWLDQNRDAANPVEADGVSTFNAQLILRFDACFSRPVPAIASSCDGASSDTAWSRILETAALELRPYGNDADGHPAPPPDNRPQTFPALRALVGQGDLGSEGSSPAEPAPQSWLEAFRLLAARDTRALEPPAFHPAGANSSRLFPVDPPGELILADLPGMQVRTTAGGPVLDAPTIDYRARRTHVPTWLLEELLGHLLDNLRGGISGAGGPLVTHVQTTDTNTVITLSGPIVVGTLVPGMALHRFDAGSAGPSWESIDLTVAGVVTYNAPPAGPVQVTVELPDPPTPTVSYRLVLSGTGPTPIVGLVDSRPVPIGGGRDVTLDLT